MTTSITPYTDAGALLTDVRDHLEAHEAENGLLLGFLDRFATEPPAEPSFMVRAHEESATIAVALRTSRNLIVSRGMAPAAEPLAAALVAHGLDLPGITGPEADATAMAEAWTRARGVAATSVVEQMLYELRTIIWPTGVPGQLRAMTDRDVELVTRWVWGFHQEALPNESFSQGEAHVNALARPAAGVTFLWEVDGVPVSMAALSRPTRHGITVNAVYTPDEYRRKGYASALVAAVSDVGLKRGKDFCVLYTDLANPTSNAIYQAIGYRPVSRSRRFAFPAFPW